MNLNSWKKYYVEDEDHFYLSKIKQYTPKEILKMSQALEFISNLIGPKSNNSPIKLMHEFAPDEQVELFPSIKNHLIINSVSSLFISLHILSEDLISIDHLKDSKKKSNKEKYKKFLALKSAYLNGDNYSKITDKFSLEWLNNDFMVHFRNFNSWLTKFGFFGQDEKSGICFITEIGYRFIESKDDIDLCSAIFLNQVKKLQVWNPTISQRYRKIKVIPYYLLLEVLLKVPENYFTKQEYALFITKIKSHKSEDVSKAINLIKEFRTLDDSKKEKYISDIIKLDEESYPKSERTRTNYERLLDSSQKEIQCYCWGNLMVAGDGQYQGKILLSDNNQALDQLKSFSSSPGFIHFELKEDWVRHLGGMDGLSIDEILEMYINSGKSENDIKEFLSNVDEDIEEKIRDKMLENEVEEYYENNLLLINPNLKIVEEPKYGRQFPTQIGPIDILCMNEKSKEYVVIEFKRSQGSDETIGQLLRYMGWVYINMVEVNENVRGYIVAHKFSDKLEYALAGIQSDHIYEIIELFSHPFHEENRPPGGKN